MERDKRKQEIDQDSLPTLSGPGIPTEEGASVPVPQVEGYEIISQLGAAGQGRVWLALQKSTKRHVALKVPRHEVLSSQAALRRFEREIELAARLDHPNIAGIYDSGIYRDVYYYAMELIEGVSLDEYVEREDLSLRQTMQLMETICEAIQYAHQNGVIHRDIKPSNIMVTADGSPHVVDFGLAISIVDGDTLRTMSIDGELTGTPAYMSPEQARGHHGSLDTRTDVYSLGIVMYKLLTGDFPYDVRSSVLQTLQNIKDVEPIRPSKIRKCVGRDIEAIMLKALAKEPGDRYASAAELRHDVDCWLKGLPIMAKSDSSLYLLRKVIARHRYTSAVVVLLFVIICGFSLFSIELYRMWRYSDAQVRKGQELLTDQKQQLDDLRDGLVIVDYFLPAWLDDDPAARKIAASFNGSPSISQGLTFLLDGEATEKGVEEFRLQRKDGSDGLPALFIAEKYRKKGDTVRAELWYRTCVRECLEGDIWLRAKAQSRLSEIMRKTMTSGREAAK